MQVAVFTREYPPDIYGGAGVHVDYLVRYLRRLADVSVHCFGAPRDGADARRPDPELDGANAALQALSVDLRLVGSLGAADVVHSHTWYANLAGHLSGMLLDVPHIVTSHSLEPLRPWKAEQLGTGYAVSSWCEQVALCAADAVIAVSAAMRRDVLACYPQLDADRVHVIHNGIDADEYRPRGSGSGPDGAGSGRGGSAATLERLGADPDRPTVVFVGRITRQKGLRYLLGAAQELDGDAQLVLCAGAPDTPELAAETEVAVADLQRRRSGVIWVRRILPKDELIDLLGLATVFVCPSIYEPLGIVNLEAMACATAVVATAVGGIPEVVADGETGLLVPFEQASPGAEPTHPDSLARGLAAAINRLVRRPEEARALGEAGRRRVVEQFSWQAVAERTLGLYESVAH